MYNENLFSMESGHYSAAINNDILPKKLSSNSTVDMFSLPKITWVLHISPQP